VGWFILTKLLDRMTLITDRLAERLDSQVDRMFTLIEHKGRIISEDRAEFAALSVRVEQLTTRISNLETLAQTIIDIRRAEGERLS
jgi:hypothetical protein